MFQAIRNRPRIYRFIKRVYYLEQLLIPIGVFFYGMWLIFFDETKENDEKQECSHLDETTDIIVMAIIIFFAGGLLNIRRFFSLGLI